MAAADVWKPAYDAKLKYNAAAVAASSVEFQENLGEFDTTNTESAGDYEFGVDVTTRKLRWTTPVKVGAVLPALKDLCDAIYSDGIDVFTGKARITSRNRKGGGKGGYTIDYEATFTGTVTKTADTVAGGGGGS
jgi:hypothetical protein